MKQHKLKESSLKGTNGLRIIECTQCQYAFFIETDNAGVLRFDTRLQIKEGDRTASHIYLSTDG